MTTPAMTGEVPRTVQDLAFVVGPVQAQTYFCDVAETEPAEMQIAVYFNKRPCNLIYPACRKCLKAAIGLAMDLAAKMLAKGQLQVLQNQGPWEAFPV